MSNKYRYNYDTDNQWQAQWDNVTVVKPSYNTYEKWIQIIYDNQELRTELDFYLADGSKINAIKHYREWCLDTDDPDWSKKQMSLRICKDTIDLYANRLTITNKIEHLRDTIEIFCNANGYDQMENYKETQIKDKVVWMYSDWEFVDDMYGNMINSQEWMPAAKVLLDMNKIYKKYKKLTGKARKYNVR
jgi:hypothetical protein